MLKNNFEKYLIKISLIFRLQTRFDSDFPKTNHENVDINKPVSQQEPLNKIRK